MERAAKLTRIIEFILREHAERCVQNWPEPYCNSLLIREEWGRWGVYSVG